MTCVLRCQEPKQQKLSEVQGLHNELNLLLTALPSVLVKTPDMILDEEVRSYPGFRTDTLVMYYLNALLGKTDLARFLSSPELKEARKTTKGDCSTNAGTADIT